MPTAASATNAVTATLNRAINSVPGIGSGATNPGSTNANRNKKTPNIPGLGFAASQV
jgi:hypothetical protein